MPCSRDFTPPPTGIHRAQEMLLARIAADGTPAVTRALLAAAHGEEAAATMETGALLRALPGVGWWAAHDLLALARVPQTARLGELSAAQRGSLTAALAHLPRNSGDPVPGKASS